MTAQPAPVVPIESAPSRRRPVHISVPRHELVGRVMDQIALAEEAVVANGASLEQVLRLPAGPWRQELQIAHHATHDALVALLVELRMSAGRYDGCLRDEA